MCKTLRMDKGTVQIHGLHDFHLTHRGVPHLSRKRNKAAVVLASPLTRQLPYLQVSKRLRYISVWRERSRGASPSARKSTTIRRLLAMKGEQVRREKLASHSDG